MSHLSGWYCLICGEQMEGTARHCWKCGSNPDGSQGIEVGNESLPVENDPRSLPISSISILLVVFATFFFYFAWRNNSILIPAICLLGIGYCSIHIFAWMLNRGVTRIRRDNLE